MAEITPTVVAPSPGPDQGIAAEIVPAQPASTSYETMTRTSDRPSAEAPEPTERIDLGTMARVEWKPPKPEDGGREVRVKALYDAGKPQREDPTPQPRASAALAEQARSRAAERAQQAEAQAQFESARDELLAAQAAGRDPTQTQAYAYVQSMAAKAQQVAAQTVTDWNTESTAWVQSRGEYQVLNALGLAHEAGQLVAQVYQQTGQVLPLGEAAQRLELHYRAMANKVRDTEWMRSGGQQTNGAFESRGPIGESERLRRAAAAMEAVSRRTR